MNCNVEKNGESYTVLLSGRLDTMTAPQFEEIIGEALENAKELTLDLQNLEYISSAGLRVILLMQKTMDKKGKMKLVHVPQSVLEIFEITGFSEFLTIED